MAKSRAVQFANFICHFGGGLELLDRLEEIVIPAFLGRRQRSYSDTNYFLHDVGIRRIPGPDQQVAIYGRFIKDTRINREQIFDATEGVIVKAPVQIESAPSAIFVLLLNGHKLMYFPEVVGAPGIESFGNTIENFLSAARIDHVNKVFLAAKVLKTINVKALTKKALYEIHPAPRVEIVHLVSRDSLVEFVERFQVLKSASIRVLQPNNEINNDGLFEALREEGENISAQTADVVYRNPSGLNKARTASHVQSALDGNADVTFDGIDVQGRRLKGSNDDFKVSVPIDDVPSGVESIAVRLYHAFLASISSGLITVPQNEVSASNLHKLAALKIEGDSDGRND